MFTSKATSSPLSPRTAGRGPINWIKVLFNSFLSRKSNNTPIIDCDLFCGTCRRGRSLCLRFLYLRKEAGCYPVVKCRLSDACTRRKGKAESWRECQQVRLFGGLGGGGGPATRSSTPPSVEVAANPSRERLMMSDGLDMIRMSDARVVTFDVSSSRTATGPLPLMKHERTR